MAQRVAQNTVEEYAAPFSGQSLDEFDRELAADIARFYDDPLGFVLWAYQW